MPSYQEHLSLTKPLAVIFGIATFLYGLSEGFSPEHSLMFGIINCTLVFLGTSLPDIDHHASIPRRQLGFVGALVGILIYISGVAYLQSLVEGYSVLGGGIVMAAGFAVLFLFLPTMMSMIGDIFDSLLTHRGFTHTIFFVAIVGAVVFYFPYFSLEYSQFNADSYDNYLILAAFAICIGALKHISDDFS